MGTEQKEKAEAKAKEEAAKAEQAALAATNTKRRMAELERNKNGKITENWVDETGIYHWKVVGSNTTLAKHPGGAKTGLTLTSPCNLLMQDTA